MQDETVRFTLRTNSELLRKFAYVAEYNARSINRELQIVMRKHISDFEKENGEIELQ